MRAELRLWWAEGWSNAPRTYVPPRSSAPFSFSPPQRTELWSILGQHNTLLVLVGHTHTAGVYSFNGTNQGEWAAGKPGFIDVVNAPATQKEDGKHNALPSEFMVLEAGFASEEDARAGAGMLRVAQRVGSGWGAVVGTKQFTCA